ncbi:NACHT domain-containing NTPase [Kovacikia minuta CCNUW1]|uniref:NACHT domain-containing protein n=1 Tax=Kovacikia minuta TaxID=2931930 RepID=UPI001CCB8131|nr:NACHT domain-containing NTPase [Kovacikia minuta]UBF24405.1 NACHT domain-containing NTPase [Kovacikia minuta CCNUW1]
MVKRSLKASFPGIQQAKRAFACKGWTQENLAGEVGLKTRQSVWRFFTGQPVERQVFQELCLILDLDWREIAIDPPAEFPEPGEVAIDPVTDIDTLVQQVRVQRQHKVQAQCGTLQLLNISRPVKIDDLYINVNILEEIPSQQWLELADLQRFTPQACDRSSLEAVSQTQMAGVKAVEIYSKLRVLGKPGTGKTTFLQHLAVRCNQGSFAANRVPIFVSLRDFADEFRAAGEVSLLSYIFDDFHTSGISNLSMLETLLQEGRVLLLLDGLDEVLAQDCKAVINEIRRLSEKYEKNLFVVTCRTAAKALNLRRFTDVEMAPFGQDQIVEFAQKWFTVLKKTTFQAGQEQAVQFVQQLGLSENIPFRRLAVTPLFLHLICWIFHHQGKFPSKRAEFYKQCLELLLSKWDETKGIERDEMYHGFLLPQKLKLLSQVATVTFEQGNYFFERQAIEQHIGDYIRSLPNAAIEPEELQLDSEEILKAIELQHGLLAERVQGIFSFGDQIFQEYFTARKIVANYNLHASDRALEQLVSHVTEPRWREIFLLTVAMLRSADSLVQMMKQEIDAIVAQDPYLQKFLTWAAPQSRAESPYLTATQHHSTQSDWDFSPEQQEILQRYYDANQLLLDCLNSNSEVTAAVRQEIEAALLLSQKELEEREWGGETRNDRTGSVN